MTRQKSFKQRVRSRMDKTGESYTAARAHLVGTADTSAQPAREPAATPGSMRARVPDDKVQGATGRGYQVWFALLDEWEATTRTHTEIAAHLVQDHAVNEWWAQTVTVAYEQERGLRVPGQKKDGFSVSASKTVAVPVEQLFAAFADPELRARWLPAQVDERTAKPGKRFTAELPGHTRLTVTFQTKGEHKSLAGIEHTRIDSADSAAEWKTSWRTWLAELKKQLESADD